MRKIENLMGNYDITHEEKNILKEFISDNANLDVYYDSYHNMIRGVPNAEVYEDPERYDLITIALTNFFDTMEIIVDWCYNHNYSISKTQIIDGRVCIENVRSN